MVSKSLNGVDPLYKLSVNYHLGFDLKRMRAYKYSVAITLKFQNEKTLLYRLPARTLGRSDAFLLLRSL